MTILQPPFLEVNHQQIFSRGDGGSRAANQQIGNRKEAQENLSTTNHQPPLPIDITYYSFTTLFFIYSGANKITSPR